MVIVDSAVWASYFNGETTRHAKILDGLLAGEEDIAIIPSIITEVLQGFRRESGFLSARDLLIRLPVLVPTISCHVEAARLFRRLREKGVTIRGAVDCIIAQTCIEHGAELLSPDIDFLRIAEHTSLKICGA